MPLYANKRDLDRLWMFCCVSRVRSATFHILIRGQFFSSMAPVLTSVMFDMRMHGLIRPTWMAANTRHTACIELVIYRRCLVKLYTNNEKKLHCVASTGKLMSLLQMKCGLSSDSHSNNNKRDRVYMWPDTRHQTEDYHITHWDICIFLTWFLGRSCLVVCRVVGHRLDVLSKAGNRTTNLRCHNFRPVWLHPEKDG